MTDLFNTFATYLHDVFVIKFDGWVILGSWRRDSSPCASWCNGSPRNARARA